MIDPHFCTVDTCSLEYAHIGYLPNLAGNALFLTIFVLILIGQLFLGIKHRTWGFMGGMFGGLVLEILGYGGRIMMHNNPFDFNAFLLYLIPLTIGPAFLSASIYLSLSRIIIAHQGPSPTSKLARFAPRTYTLFFVTCDIFSLILQAAGGALAATANTPEDGDTGVNVMIAGLVFQVVSLVVFFLLWGDFVWRSRRANANMLSSHFEGLRATRMFKLFQIALALAALFIFIRSVFRVAELQEGFDGHLANDEVTFMILEGPMIILATILLTVFHPGTCFQGMWGEATWSLRGKNGKTDEEKFLGVGSEESLRNGGVGSREAGIEMGRAKVGGTEYRPVDRF
ncbi:RTA1-domain-containing protein [Aulographum hederae CBS 113979]|uniref:RTA1-domain-containing protein n=1 Tax=Aulographum hederae CBS 113979 TaxID=1176131 RepID=A0A6G1GVR1_9PEZI|nr:RTA1-domain-containing protein [Aulographum hederae CBS 113979]